MKTKNNECNTTCNKGLEMALKCDAKAKEERIRHMIENRLEKISVFGNVVLQWGKEILEKSASED